MGRNQGHKSAWNDRSEVKISDLFDLSPLEVTLIISRATHIVDCRESMGLGKGGGLAQRGTISETGTPDIVAIGMSPGRRHITKPICEITHGLRNEGFQVGVQNKNADLKPFVSKAVRDLADGLRYVPSAGGHSDRHDIWYSCLGNGASLGKASAFAQAHRFAAINNVCGAANYKRHLSRG